MPTCHGSSCHANYLTFLNVKTSLPILHHKIFGWSKAAPQVGPSVIKFRHM